MSAGERHRVGAVVIGRNEGARLERCLRSLGNAVERLVYVDSGSTDGSVPAASKLRADVLVLDDRQPFTMARARNTGLHFLQQRYPELDFVHFVDGDCEVRAGWVERAREHLAAHPDVAVVCGRRRERFPNASRYNRLIDMEWSRTAGDVPACGGDALMRMEALRQAGGFDPVMIAGEEPELCCRLRLAGWRVVRLDAEMTLHDANLRSFAQWWRRALRGGHAYAEGARLHGRSRLRHNVRPLRSALCWGLAVPAATGALLVLSGIAAGVGASGLAVGAAAIGGLGLLAYPVQVLRVYRGARRTGRVRSDAALYALFCVLGKIPEALGAVRFHRSRNRTRHLIEYR